jgi:isoprenylcysteine carboxyl methyltransferase (ICMT) family protein YpbQ
LTGAELLLVAVTLQRAGELVISRHNTRKLMALGAVEMASGHYPLIVKVHAAWLISLFYSALLEGMIDELPAPSTGLPLWAANRK